MDSTASSAFSLSATFDITNDDDDIPRSLKKIWEYFHCDIYSENYRNGWKCLLSGNFQKRHHHTCSVSHFSKQKGGDIDICLSVIPPTHAALYAKLYQDGTIKNEARNLVSSETQSFVKKRLEAAVVVMERKSEVISTTNPFNFITVGWSKSANSISDIYHQPSINAAIKNASHTDINMSNKSQLQMAIDIFWHCENIPDRVVESHRFQTLITKSRLAGSDFKIPNLSQVGGDLLENNYNSCMENNVGLIGKDVEVFAIMWMSDEATMFRMPLVNILVMCVDVPPIGCWYSLL